MAAIRKRTWTTKGETRTAWVADYFDQGGKRRLKTFKTRKAADAWMVGARAQVAAGTHTADSASTTIADAARLWLERADAEDLEPATRSQYAVLSRHLLTAIGGGTRLSRITPALCEQVRDRLLAACPRLTASKTLAVLKAILKDARRRGLVAQNAASETRITTAGRHKRRLEVGVDIPAPAEIKALLAAAAPKARALICLAALAGLRASELRGLRWADVTLGAKPTVAIAQRADYRGTIGSPKSVTSRRTIPLTPLAASALREWRLAQPPSRSLVFGTATDRPDDLPNIRRRLLFPLEIAAGVVDRAGHPKYALHSFRHFAISSWLAGGIDLKTSQHWAGHATLALTLDTYGHLIPRTDDHDRIAAIERLVR